MTFPEILTRKRFEWAIIAQSALISRNFYGSTIASQIMTELLVVPDEAIPERPEEMWNEIIDYITWALSKGTEPQPEWYDDEWISKDW